MEVLSRDYGEQRPDRADEEGEDEGAGEGGLQLRGVAEVAGGRNGGSRHDAFWRGERF